jgi:hypothetical protein
VDRAHFPSRPAVSTPFILAHTMQLLDEIGVDEAEYTQRSEAQQNENVRETQNHRFSTIS